MDSQQREILIRNMTDNLPTLRKKMNVNQEELSEMVGVSRTTLALIERGKGKMSWNMFLALLLVFIKNRETDKLLNVLGIYTDEFNEFIKHENEE